MPKELIYKVKIIPDDAGNKKFAQSVKRGQEQAEKATKDTISEINREISQLELLGMTGRKSGGELSEAIERLNKDLATAPKQTEKVIRAQKRLLKLQDRLGDSFAQTGRQSRVMRNTISGANQTLFSFGDIVNDAQQFQFGFAQGSRAIGNNIAFMAEQFAGVTNRAGGFTGALKAIGGSLLGPGGIIIGINLVISALTIFGDKLFSTKEKAKLTKEEIEGLTGVFNDFSGALAGRKFFGEDPFGISRLGFDQQLLKQVIKDTQSGLEGLTNETKDHRLEVLELQKGFSSLNQAEQEELTLLFAQKEQAVQIQRIVDQLVKDQITVTTELEKQRIIRAKVIEIERQAEAFRQSVFDLRAQRQAEQFRQRFSENISPVDAVARVRVSEQVEPPDIAGMLAPRLDTIRGVEQQISNLQGRFVTARTQVERDAIQADIDAQQRRLDAFRGTEQAKTAIQRMEEQARIQLTSQAVQTASALLGAAFGKNKGVAIAATLLETFAAAQAAYRSQLTVPTPDASLRAAAAAALAVAQGLARVATMRKITPENQSAGGGGAGGGAPAEGFQTGIVQPSQPRQSRDLRQLLPEPRQKVVINLSGDIADSSISKRAETGRKQRLKTAIRVQSA